MTDEPIPANNRQIPLSTLFPPGKSGKDGGMDKAESIEEQETLIPQSYVLFTFYLPFQQETEKLQSNFPL